MPASGKSTVGLLLAKAAGLQFVDTDLLIQKHTGETLQQTINRDGIEVFLKVENLVLSEIDYEKTVISTGGSAVLSDYGMQNLKRNGTVIFLDLSVDEITRRIDNITTRGIAMGKDETIKDVFNKRLPLYRQYADLTVESSNLSPEDTVRQILLQMNK